MAPTGRHFFVGGAQRSGTTWLWHLLDSHPEIEMARPLRPEPKFFLDDLGWRAGPAAYHCRFFSSAAHALLCGEKSTSYLERPDAARRIHQLLPAARVLFVLRDPIERAISNYWFSVANGLETATIEEAFAKEDQRSGDYDPARISVSPFAYRARGLYDRLLRSWEEVFPPQQLAVFVWERLVSLDEELTRLLGFLGVSEQCGPLRPPAVSRSARPKDMPDHLRRTLAAAFRVSSLAVARRHGLDLSLWPSLAVSCADPREPARP